MPVVFPAVAMPVSTACPCAADPASPTSPLPTPTPRGPLSLADCIAEALLDLCNLNDPRLTHTPGLIPHARDASSNAMFYTVSKLATPVPLRTYIKRFEKYTRASKAAFVLAAVYLGRVSAIQHAHTAASTSSPSDDEWTQFPLTVNSRNAHRLFLTALLLAHKYIDDEPHSNEDWARVAGVPSIREVNKMEAAMLRMLQFELFVSTEVFNVYWDLLCECCGEDEAFVKGEEFERESCGKARMNTSHFA